MLKKYEELPTNSIYKLMSQTITPRPIAWIVTEDNGVINAAPFSYFIPLSSNPPTVIVSIGHKEDETPKDTLANIRKNKKATICFVNETNLEDMKKSAEALPHEMSETETFHIETTAMLKGYPPMIASTKTALFCELFEELDIGGKTIPVILKIDVQYIDDNIIDEKDNIRLDNIGRVGKSFAKIVEI